VYTVVFNMEVLMKSEDSEEYKRFLEKALKFWLDSIATHTMSEIKEAEGASLPGGGAGGTAAAASSTRVVERTAPVVLVGTWKDKVSNPSDHARISDIIEKAFSSSHLVFTSGSLLQNSDLTFSPVNNRLGRDDPTFKSLMSSIENEIDVSDYVHQEHPISWLDTFDKMKALRRPFFTYADTLDIARSSGVNELEVAEMLSFLHDMGMLM
jgi:hypothetical protein